MSLREPAANCCVNRIVAVPTPPVMIRAPRSAPLLPTPPPMMIVPFEPAFCAITIGASVPLAPLKPPRLRSELLPSMSVATSPAFCPTVTTVVPCSRAPAASASVPEWIVVVPV